MRILLALIGGLSLMTSMATGEYPSPAELPSHPALPDPLVMFDGSRVATAEEWSEKRRPELKALFEQYVYGRYPQVAGSSQTSAVQSKVLFEDPQAFGGAGTLKEVELTLGPPEWPKIYLLIATPNGKTPAACFVGMNFGGNHLLVDDERVHVPETWMPDRYTGVVDNRATDASRGVEGYTWPLAAIVARGYAAATFHCGDIQPDRPHVREGMRATLPEDADDAAETATIMWWAWGIQRAIDYLATDPAIDPARIAAVGHSRLGKTALLAGAFDERIALTVANQAGCGGSGPSRHDEPKAETVEIITRNFPHWFCANLRKFADDPARLPVDQNCLVALCAPRAVLFTAAEDDRWANPSGQFAVLRAASPAYELLGVDGLKADAMPAADAPLLGDGRLGFWFRAGEHSMTPADWKVYMDFADRQLK
ncbi:MAG: acetylxylan esterase [Planctomycetaceae bacterium]|nr:acetylxylan esterase [Planctomycetaceae bacterium]